MTDHGVQLQEVTVVLSCQFKAKRIKIQAIYAVGNGQIRL